MPFDWGYFAFVHNADLAAPSNFRALGESDLRIVIQDPRSSTPGLGLLLIVLTFFLPGGIVYGVRKLRARFVQIVPAGPTDPGDDGDTTLPDDHPHEDRAERILDRDDGASAAPVSAPAQATNQGEPT